MAQRVFFQHNSDFSSEQVKISDTCTKFSSTIIVLALVLFLYAASRPSEGAISCSDVIKDLRPCVSYLSSAGGGKPSAACCAGAKALASAASTPGDKKTACNCIKSASKSVTINAQSAQALPASCGISLSISVSPNADCSK
ncbi:non-specific lipid-transfer protein 8 [Senna tora]|uniref:Non-specific lipid-transfer protein n=1 Tax=Senna tora TaxID=362788 RepID=A0A834TNY2_9FABA|nr:non-specific lipid-transfer protein 8 [Senna tora]